MLSDDKKKRIESLSTDEMLFEINLGRNSRFQREKFAYLKTCYQNRCSKAKSEQQKQAVPKPATSPPNTKPNKHKNVENISLYKIAERVISAILILFIIWILLHYFGINL